MIGAWIAGGLISLVGALCYAELATTYPHVGGSYYYLRQAFGQRPGNPVCLGQNDRHPNRVDCPVGFCVGRLCLLKLYR